ncbi:MAG: hypothetical protein VYD54_04350 [Bdellovibrionota bacterium]|nr:hypothetical protein [Bdellovibrionota bacterium]
MKTYKRKVLPEKVSGKPIGKIFFGRANSNFSITKNKKRKKIPEKVFKGPLFSALYKKRSQDKNS